MKTGSSLLALNPASVSDPGFFMAFIQCVFHSVSANDNRFQDIAFFDTVPAF
jgi:hypothetical protein